MEIPNWNFFPLSAKAPYGSGKLMKCKMQNMKDTSNVVEFRSASAVHHQHSKGVPLFLPLRLLLFPKGESVLLQRSKRGGGREEEALSIVVVLDGVAACGYTRLPSQQNRTRTNPGPFALSMPQNVRFPSLLPPFLLPHCWSL